MVTGQFQHRLLAPVGHSGTLLLHDFDGHIHKERRGQGVGKGAEGLHTRLSRRVLRGKVLLQIDGDLGHILIQRVPRAKKVF